MSTRSKPIRNPADEDHDVWVLAGQSNMHGFGWLEGATSPDPRVWSFSSAGHWIRAEEPLHKLWESFTPVHQELLRRSMPEQDKQIDDAEWARREDETRTRGAGLGLSFGKALADAHGRAVGLIPAAHGGSSLGEWSPALRDLGGRSLYGAMLERISKAGGRLRGILWYQGESDTLSSDLGRSYGRRLDEWIASVRRDIGISDLPVIAVQIGRVIVPSDRVGVWRGWNLVQEAIRTLPERVPNTAVTSAVDLSLADIIHVDTVGLIRLGKRLARLALVLTEGAAFPAGPVIESTEIVKTPDGIRNAIRIEFAGLAGHWRASAGLRGFDVRLDSPERHDPLYVVNAWVERESGNGNDVIVLLNREPDRDVPLSLAYGFGTNPICELVDEADMPLCAYLWRPVGRA